MECVLFRWFRGQFCYYILRGRKHALNALRDVLSTSKTTRTKKKKTFCCRQVGFEKGKCSHEFLSSRVTPANPNPRLSWSCSDEDATPGSVSMLGPATTRSRRCMACGWQENKRHHLVGKVQKHRERQLRQRNAIGYVPDDLSDFTTRPRRGTEETLKTGQTALEFINGWRGACVAEECLSERNAICSSATQEISS